MAVSIVTVEEQVRGWLAEISRHRDPHRQISPYAKLQRQIDLFADWIILPWDADSADLFVKLRRQGLRIGPWIGKLPASLSRTTPQSHNRFFRMTPCFFGVSKRH